MEKYLDEGLAPEKRAEDLLSRMSLDEKMGQINCIFPLDQPLENYQKACLHGIGQVSTLALRSVTSLEEAATWQRSYQNMIMAQSEHHIPATFHMEGLCGAFLQGAASFPAGIGRGASFDPELEEKIGAIVSRQELSCGITQVLAPVLDISRDSRLGRQGETYGEDSTLTASMGAAFVRGVQTQEVAGRHAESEAKHFLGFHYSLAGIHGANVELGERQLMEVYAKPFQAAIRDAGLRGVMPCYCSVNGEPISSSRKFLTQWLRKDMGFDGVVGADYSAVSNVYHAQHVAESETEAGIMCLTAGLDIEQQNCVCYNNEMKEKFASGEADLAILNQAVLRVLTAKFRMGLFEHPFALEGENLKTAFSHGADQNIILQSALESLVLLKNDGTLPLKKNCRKIAVVGAQAKNSRIFFGGYTHESMEEAVHAVANSIAGMESGSVQGKEMLTVPGTQIQSDETEEFDAVLQQQKPDCKSLLEQLREDLPEVNVAYAYGYAVAGDDLSHLEEALKVCEGADLILVTLGGKNGSCSVASMGEGVDGTDINLPKCQDVFLDRAAKLGIPMVGVHFNGRPASSDTADKCLNAMLEAWSPSEMGAKAISMVLRGEYNPSGKMPVTTARVAGQIPIFYSHDNGSSWHQGESIGFSDYVDMPHRPRYYFGQGLSYTTFAYSNCRLSQKEVTAADQLEVCFELTNTGDCLGTEVVQLYVRDEKASVIRPVKELEGFGRVKLRPGETRHVTFLLPVSQLAFVGRDMNWKVEKGTVEIQIGSSSEDIRLKDAFLITESKRIVGRERGLYAEFKCKE